MPQFPFQTTANEDESLSSDSGETKKQKKPIQFKRVQAKGPVTRVRIKEGGRSSNGSRKSPFKEEGLFEDKDSLIRFRDDVGRPLLLTLIAIAVVVFIYRWSRPPVENQDVTQVVASLLLKADQFDEKLPTSETEFNDRIETANQLLAFTDDSSAVERGAEIKLKTIILQCIGRLGTKNKDEDQIKELESLCRKYLSRRNQAVSNSAMIGLTLIRAERYLEEPEIQFFPQILDQFKLVSEYAKDDLISSHSLMQIANAFQTKQLKTESLQLYRAINMANSGSTNQEIAEIGKQARKYLANNESTFDELKQIIADFTTAKNFPTRMVFEKITQDTQADTVSAGKLEGILDFAELLVRRKAVPVAKEILKRSRPSIGSLKEGIEREAVKKRHDELGRLLDRFGQAFQYDGLFSVEGRPISVSNFKRIPKLIVFWSPQQPASIKLIQRLSQNSKLFADRDIQVIAVAEINDNAEDRSRLLEKSNQIKGIDFLTLVKFDRTSQSFKNRYPFRNLPFWILLDPDDKIRGFNTDIDFVSMRIDEPQ